ncbi:MAG: MFS transporter [Rhodospirillales bacterium]|nr:MFS transporter [Rhodospirillales bacterium]
MAVRFSSVVAILLGTAFLSIGQGLHQALIPISAEALKYSATTISILASVYFGGYLLGCFAAPYLIKRVSHIRTLAVAASLLSALSLGHIIVPNEALWVLFRICVGFSFACIDVVMESWLASRSTNEDRGKLLSFYRFIDLFALGVGQFLIASASPTEFILFAFVAIFVSISVIIVSLSVAPTPDPPDNVKVRFLHVLQVSPLAIVVGALHGVASGIYWGFAPVFATGISDNKAMVGSILASTVIGAAIAQFPVGWASDRYDRRILIIWFSLFASITSLLVFGASFKFSEAILPILALFGATAFAIYPIAMTYAFDRAKPEEFFEVGASVLIAFGAGAFVGPLLVPFTLHFGNNSGAFLLIAVIYLLVFGFAIYRASRTDAVPEENAVEFVAMPSTTPVTLEIDPRVEDGIPTKEENTMGDGV